MLAKSTLTTSGTNGHPSYAQALNCTHHSKAGSTRVSSQRTGLDGQKHAKQGTAPQGRVQNISQRHRLFFFFFKLYMRFSRKTHS